MSQRPKIALLTTVLNKGAHAEHIADRFPEGYGWNGRHHRPQMDLVSMYVDQIDDSDLSAEREARFPQLTRFPTIADALTLGGSELAVDGVLLIGEHGNYPNNEKGQTLWPRYEFFKQMAAVFRASSRGVPVFNDKHLSWNWEWAKEMYDISRKMDFPFMAGSSLPVTWRTPSVEMPLGAEVEEAMCVGGGWFDGGDFHAYAEERWSHELLRAGLCRSHLLTPSRAGFNHILPTIDEMRQMVTEPWAFQYGHADGLVCTLLKINGLVSDFNFVARLSDREEPLSTQMYLPVPPTQSTIANCFSPLVNNIEAMFLSGKPSYPVERTLLTTGLTAAGVESVYRDQARIDTPHLDISYQPNPDSTYWRT